MVKTLGTNTPENMPNRPAETAVLCLGELEEMALMNVSCKLLNLR